jgi:hypothetical protein
MTMGRTYTVQFNGVAVTAQQDFFEIVAPADACVELLEIHLSQSSDVGDAAEEGLSILLKSGSTVSGSGGSAPTAVPLSLGDAAFGGTCEVNNTSKANTGTIVTHAAWNWNIRVPFDVIFTPETTKILSPSARMTVELATTPADSLTISGYAVIKEIGG